MSELTPDQNNEFARLALEADKAMEAIENIDMTEADKAFCATASMEITKFSLDLFRQAYSEIEAAESTSGGAVAAYPRAIALAAATAKSLARINLMVENDRLHPIEPGQRPPSVLEQVTAIRDQCSED